MVSCRMISWRLISRGPQDTIPGARTLIRTIALLSCCLAASCSIPDDAPRTEDIDEEFSEPALERTQPILVETRILIETAESVERGIE